MDENNKKILTLLRQNSRYSYQELSEMLDIASDDIESRIKQMMDDGIIRQFTTVINDNELSGFPIKALVELSIRPEKGTGYDSIAKRMIGYSNVVSHYLVSGQYDFLVVVEGKNHKEIAHFVFDKLATLENVKSTTTHFIFKSYKEQGVLLDQDELNSRVAIMP